MKGFIELLYCPLHGPLDESRTHTPYWNPGLSRARLPVSPQGGGAPQHSPSLACKELRGLFSYVFSIPLVWCLCFVTWINQHIDAILFQDQGKKHVSIMPDTFSLKAVNCHPMLVSHLQERPVLLSDNDTAFGRKVIEVLTTQDSCRHPLHTGFSSLSRPVV